MNNKELKATTILLTTFMLLTLTLFIVTGFILLETKQTNTELDARLEIASLKLDEVKELNKELKEEVEELEYQKSRSLYCSLSSVQCNE